MDRLFPDANVLFSAAHSAKAGLLQFWKLKNVVLCFSRYALEEASINLKQRILTNPATVIRFRQRLL
jgi:hypothetical protein